MECVVRWPDERAIASAQDHRGTANKHEDGDEDLIETKPAGLLVVLEITHARTRTGFCAVGCLLRKTD